MPDTPVDPSLVEALSRYVALLREPGPGLAAAYHPAAPLYVAGAITTREQAAAGPTWPSRPDLVAPHVLAARVEGGRGAGEPRAGDPGAGEFGAGDEGARDGGEGERAVVWFRAREAVDDRDVTGAVGFERAGGAWRVYWATLGEPGDWSFGHGLAQALADVAIADAAGFGATRSWLDVAYYRLHLKPRPPLLTLPEARFRCGASLGCCDIGYRIEVPPTAQAVVDAMPWDEVRPALAGTRLEPQASGNLLVKDAGERCRFLDEDKHCVLHKALGRAVFPVCTQFPVHFAHTPDGVAVSLDMTCPSARQGLGPPLREREEDLYLRLAALPPKSQVDTFKLAPDVPAAWVDFRAAEAELLAILADGTRPLSVRLEAGERALQARLGVDAPRPAPLDAESRADGVALVEEAVRLMVPALGPGPLAWPTDPADVAELVAALRGLLFTKTFSFSLDLLTAWHVALFQGLAIARVQGARVAGAGDGRALWRLNGLFFHTDLFTTLRPDLAQAAGLMHAFGQPWFGWSLLELGGPSP